MRPFIFILIFVISTSLFLASPSDSFDRDSYLAHFEGLITFDFTNPLSYIFDEPLWVVYSILFGLILEPNIAYAITIILSTMLFFSSFRYKGLLSLLAVLLFFIIHPFLYKELFNNQIRQGFALSTVLFSLRYGFMNNNKKCLFLVFLGGLIHVSALYFLFFMAFFHFSFRGKILLLFSISIILFLGTSIFSDSIMSKFNTHKDDGVFNINFYLLQAVLFFPFLLLIFLREYTHNHDMLYSIITFWLLTLIVSLINPMASGRLLYFPTILLFYYVFHQKDFRIKSLFVPYTFMAAILLLMAK
jgi:hypothetical protein